MISGVVPMRVTMSAKVIRADGTEEELGVIAEWRAEDDNAAKAERDADIQPGDR